MHARAIIAMELCYGWSSSEREDVYEFIGDPGVRDTFIA